MRNAIPVAKLDDVQGKRTTVLPRHDRAAERIITTEGFTFALAASAGLQEDIREARKFLKAAIIRALVEEGRQR